MPNYRGAWVPGGSFFFTRVKWKDKNWNDLKGKTVALRIWIDRATVYSFWTNASEIKE